MPIIKGGTSWNKLEPLEIAWNELEPCGTNWNNLEQGGTIWNEMDSETNWHKK